MEALATERKKGGVLRSVVVPTSLPPNEALLHFYAAMLGIHNFFGVSARIRARRPRRLPMPQSSRAARRLGIEVAVYLAV